MGLLNGKVALISGAARGQGRLHAVRLASEGADIEPEDISNAIIYSCSDLGRYVTGAAMPVDAGFCARRAAD